MKNKTILILGAGLMQVVAIQAAKKLGYRVCVVDGSACAIGVSEADYFKVADLKYPDEVIEAAKEWDAKFGLDGVFTAATDFSLTVSKVAAYYNLPGISIDTAMKASNKGLMREAFKTHCVAIPKFTRIEFKENSIEAKLETLISEIGFPLVTKPVDNMGGRGIRLSQNKEELYLSIQDAQKYSRTGEVIVEEYIDGPEFSIDSLVVNGKVYLTGLAERHIFFPPYFIEMGHTMPADPEKFDKTLLQILTTTFEEGVAALGIENGVAKGDIKIRYESGKPSAYIGEIAARLSGGYMSGWTFPYATSFPLTQKAIEIAMGIDINPPQFKYEFISLEKAFISLPGTVESITLPNRKNFPLLMDLFLRIKEGDKVKFPANNVEKCGNIILKGKDRKKLEDQAYSFLQKITIQLKTSDPQTYQYLIEGKNEAQIPPVFHLNSPDENSYSIYVKNNPKKKKECFQFVIKENPFNSISVDWEGRNLSQLWKQLKDEGIIATQKGVFKSDIMQLKGDIFKKVLSRGGRQGLIWLLGAIDEHEEWLV